MRRRMFIAYITALAVVFAAAAVFGCNSSKATFVDLVDVSVESPSQAMAGEPVEIQLSIENKTHSQVTYYHCCLHNIRILIRRSDGTNVWWAWQYPTEDMWKRATLAPGAKDVFSTEWNQTTIAGNKVPAGEYFVVAEFSVRLSSEVAEPVFESEPVRLIIQ